MQPLTSYWPATVSPGFSCGRNEYGLPQDGHLPSEAPLPSEPDRRPPVSAVPAEPLGLRHHRVGHQRFERVDIADPRDLDQPAAELPDRRKHPGRDRHPVLRFGVDGRPARCAAGRRRHRRQSGAEERLRGVRSRPVVAPVCASAAWVPGSTSSEPDSLFGRSEISAISPDTSVRAGRAPGREPLTTCGTTCSRCRLGGCVPACR